MSYFQDNKEAIKVQTNGNIISAGILSVLNPLKDIPSIFQKAEDAIKNLDKKIINEHQKRIDSLK
jgi:hypothetical protein